MEPEREKERERDRGREETDSGDLRKTEVMLQLINHVHKFHTNTGLLALNHENDYEIPHSRFCFFAPFVLLLLAKLLQTLKKLT